jgi:signal transduction histidine kinase
MSHRPAAARIAARTIEYSGLVVLVGGAFLVIVLGGETLLRLEPPHAGLTLTAAVLLAVTFEPARRGLRRLANRVVYRHRSSPWEAVSRLAAQMGHDRDPVDLLAEMARVVLAGTGASAVVVWLRIESTWVPAARCPREVPADPVPVRGDEPLRPPGADLVVPILHGGELLGAIAVTKSSSGSLIPLEQRLVTDLASHAGIVTRTLHLRESLRSRLEVSRERQRELVTSRAQLIAAHDAERRRLERDVHDTCQQQAVLLAGRLGLASTLARSDPAAARTALDEAADDVERLASALDRLTRAAPVPELVASGIAAALRAQTAHLPGVEVDDHTRRRHHAEIEAAIYFCAMEAIQNATKHAQAEHVLVTVAEPNGWLRCSVRDDGSGFDTRRPGGGTGLRNMRERLAPWRGRLTVRSSPAGTEVTAQIPTGPGAATP